MSFFAHLLLWRWRIWALFLAALAGGLCFVPLLGVLGYESSLVFALAGSIASAHLGAVYVAAARRRDAGLSLGLERRGRAMALLYSRAALANALLLLPPLGLLCLNALRVKNCDLVGGVAFFAALPLVSSALATAAGLLAALCLPRPLLGTLAGLALIFASLLWGLWRFYDAPAIFAYDPFVGYFAGTLYDENIALRAPYYWARLTHLLWLGVALCAGAHLLEPGELRLGLGRPRPGRVRTPALLLCLAGGLVLFVARGPLGVAPGAADVARALGGVRHTRHFTIHYPKELPAEAVALLAEDHELRYAQLARWFGGGPARIRSFFFRSPAEKQRLMGAGHTFIAKPWRQEVYLQQGAFPHRTLKHELAHVFAGRYGDRLFGVSVAFRALPLPHPVFNVGLIEGVAVAADNRPYGEATLHQRAAALLKLGLAPPLSALFGTRFLAQASSRAYTLAGSFCAYLARTHGTAALLAAYRDGGAFSRHFGAPLTTLEGRWQRYLRARPLPRAVVQLAEEQFRRPSIFSRVCSHQVALLYEEAAALRKAGQADQAAAALEQICRFDPGDPGHRLAHVRALLSAGQTERARQEAEDLLQHPALSKPLRRRVEELLGDLHWRAGRVAEAESLYARAARHGATAGERRVLALKRFGLRAGKQDGPPRAAAELLRDYIAPPPQRPRSAALDTHLAHTLHLALLAHPGAPARGTGLYLVAKQLVIARQPGPAVAPLERALELGLQGPGFTREALLTLGRAAYLARDTVTAERAFSALVRRPGIPAGTRLLAHDWLQRIAWRRHGYNIFK